MVLPLNGIDKYYIIIHIRFHNFIFQWFCLFVLTEMFTLVLDRGGSEYVYCV